MLAARYFNDLQRAAMVRGENIAKTSILLETAVGLCIASPSFNIRQFRKDLFGEAGKSAFRADMQECKYLNITRLPTLLFRTAAKRALLMTGFQSYESLKAAWQKIGSTGN
jgi:predicted DsbA family dithiol-disulfide isomerase